MNKKIFIFIFFLCCLVLVPTILFSQVKGKENPKLSTDQVLEKYDGAFDLAVIKDPSLEKKLSGDIDEEDRLYEGLLRQLIEFEKQFVEKMNVSLMWLKRVNPHVLSWLLTSSIVNDLENKLVNDLSISTTNDLFNEYLQRLQLFSYLEAMQMAAQSPDPCLSYCLRDLELVQVLDLKIQDLIVHTFIGGGGPEPPPGIIGPIEILDIVKIFCFQDYKK